MSMPGSKPGPLLALLFGLYLVTALAAAATYPMLPQRVASHFRTDGTPNGWSSRRSFVVGMISASALLGFSTAGPLYLARFLSDSAINLPRREFWLAPGRREATLDRMFSIGLQLGCASAAFMLTLYLMIVRANLAPRPRLPASSGLGVTAAYLAGVAAILVLGMRPFWAAGRDGPGSAPPP